jgi:hypothetical protein
MMILMLRRDSREGRRRSSVRDGNPLIEKEPGAQACTRLRPYGATIFLGTPLLESHEDGPLNY